MEEPLEYAINTTTSIETNALLELDIGIFLSELYEIIVDVLIL